MSENIEKQIGIVAENPLIKLLVCKYSQSAETPTTAMKNLSEKQREFVE